MPKSKNVPPAGLALCEGKSECGPLHYDGTKGGPKPTDELVCEIVACKDDACDCKLCYTIKFKGHPDTFLFLPWNEKPMRSQVAEIEKDAKNSAKKLGLEIEKLDWRCFCLKPKPISIKGRTRR